MDYREFFFRSAHRCVLSTVQLWILSSLSFVVVNSAGFTFQGDCMSDLHEFNRVNAIHSCGIDPNPPEKITDFNNCSTTCLYKNLRPRRPKRMAEEIIPYLLNYPEDPDFREDYRMCLVFPRLIWTSEDVFYNVQMGQYKCTLHVWRANGTAGPDVTWNEGYMVARFVYHLYGKNNRIMVSTTAETLAHQSWDFTIGLARQSFESQVANNMRRCLEVLILENTSPTAKEARTVQTDHCVVQAFPLSYPSECTSQSFEGGWKRGQTVTSANWTVEQMPEDRGDTCYDIGAFIQYSVINEFTDRLLSIEPQQLRPGLNRVCNDFLFSPTFGSGAKTKEYGPYSLKICGYLIVGTAPCISLKPIVEESEVLHRPIREEFILDATGTLEGGEPDDFRFIWNCTVKATGEPCPISTEEGPILAYTPSDDQEGQTLEISLTVIQFPGSEKERNASDYRLILVVNPFGLAVSISCMSNCNPRSVSVTPVVLRADCGQQCSQEGNRTYTWNMTEVTNPDQRRVISGEELLKLVENGQVSREIFSTSGAGNIFLERVFEVCVLVTQGTKVGEECHRLSFEGAPLPDPGDGCIITPYSAELPGFLEYSYSGLCNWRSDNKSLLFKVFTYDVGKPEHERIYDLVAFSDISRMPSLELPFGNPNYDYQLGVVFHISNDEGLTYVYDIKESFDKIGVVFKVRKPVDYSFLEKVDDITTLLTDKKKTSHFGSRQGIINVAGLVASVVDHDSETHVSGLTKGKRTQIRESVLSSLVPLANGEVNTVRQLTPILDKLTRKDSELSNEAQIFGIDVLLPLTEGLVNLASDDFKTADELAGTQYEILERFATRSVLDQEDALLTNRSTEENRKQFTSQANSYAKMFTNIATSLVSSTLHPNTSRVEEKPKSAIAVKWLRVRNDTTLSVSKERHNGSSFGSSVSVDTASLNLSAGMEISIIMTVHENNLFQFAQESEQSNMPMVNMLLLNRGTKRPVNTSRLKGPASIFIERTTSNETMNRYIWERINITEPSPENMSYVMMMSTTHILNASITHALLVKFKASDDTFRFQIAVDFVSDNGSRHEIYPNKDYPPVVTVNMQEPENLFLPSRSDNESGIYEIMITLKPSLPCSTTYSLEESPHILMLAAKLSCQTWNADALHWEDEGCQVTNKSTLDVLHCRCTHLSIFSGGILVPANTVDIFQVELFAEFFNNPAIVSVIVFIWFVYFILLFWAHEEDRLDTYRSRVGVLEDNQVSDQWAYLVCCVTGWWINSGTTARVFIYLKGTKGMSRVHRLKDDEQQLFVKGAENWFILTTPACLGRIKSVVLWHDSSGDSPAWFVKEVFVQDINRGDSWHCLFNDWISVEHGSGELCVEVPAMTPEEIHQKKLYQTLLMTSLGFRNRHIWLSILLKSPYSTFTRVQRLTCALCVLLTTMLSSLMFYGIPTTDPNEQVSKGRLRLDPQSIVIGLQGSLVVFPISVLLVQLFSRTSTRPKTRQYPNFALDEGNLVEMELEANRISSRSEVSQQEGGSSSEMWSLSEEESDIVKDKKLTEEEEGKEEPSSQSSLSTSSISDDDSTDYQISKHDTIHISDINLATISEEETSFNKDPSVLNYLKVFIKHSDIDDSGSSVNLDEDASTQGSQDSNTSANAYNPEKRTTTVPNPAGKRQSPDHRIYESPDHVDGRSPQHDVSIVDIQIHSTGRDSSLLHCSTSSVFDMNNSAKISSTGTRHQYSGDGKGEGHHRARRMTQQFNSIAETPWFHTAVTFLRGNIGRMLRPAAEKRQRVSDSLKQGGSTSIPGSDTASSGHSSYFHRLKRNVQRRKRTDEHAPKAAREVHVGDGDWENIINKDDHPRLTYLDRLKAKRQSQLIHQNSTQYQQKPNPPPQTPQYSTAPMETCSFQDEHPQPVESAVTRRHSSPQRCWFCNCVPGQSQAIRHLEALNRKHSNRGRPVEGQEAYSTQHSSKHRVAQTIKAKLKKAVSHLRPKKKASDPSPSSMTDEKESEIPFERIRQHYDYEYEQASRQGPRALKAFRRQAAQCIAEDMLRLNYNRNAASQESQEESSQGDKQEEKSKRPGCCRLCMKACCNTLMATFLCFVLCQCPRSCKVPWWVVYISWTLAIFVALSSSWVVMLYGLRLGYQRSVDWLSSFFTGWFHSVAVVQPIKVVLTAMLYIIILGQHVDFREEAGISVADDDQTGEPLYRTVLKDMEARKKMLDGMWTTTDYQYPVPRSKAKDIKLRLEQDARARLILRETFVWALFFFTVTVSSLGHTKVSDAHATNTVLRNMMGAGSEDGVSFEDIHKNEDVYEYLSLTMLPALYAYPNGMTVSNESLVLGSVRLTQIRQRLVEDACQPAIQNRHVTTLSNGRCFPEWNNMYEDTNNYNLSWQNNITDDPNFENTPVPEKHTLEHAFLYRTAMQNRDFPVWGHVSVYPGGGYTVHLGSNLDDTTLMIETLRNADWLDRQTRALVIRVNIYTPSKDLLTAVRILCEWTQAGPLFMNLDLQTARLHWYTSDYDTFVSMAEIGWLVMMSYNMYNEMREMIQVGFADYMSNPWTYLELVNFFLSLIAIAAQIARVLVVDLFLDEVIEAQFEHYVSFAVPQFLDLMLNLTKSLIFMAVTLKVFKVMRFNRYFGVLLQSIYIARHSIFSQTLIALVLFMGFGMASIILLGPHLKEYRNLSSALMSLLLLGLGDADVDELKEAAPIMGPLMFYLFIVLFAIVTLSFFVTFILESFNVSRIFVQLNAEEQHVVRYVLTVWRLLIGATPKIKQVRRRRRTHPFKQASFTPKKVALPE